MERIQYYSNNIEVEEPLLVRLPDKADPQPRPAPAAHSKVAGADAVAVTLLPPAEAAARLAAAAPPPSWPSQGQIEFVDVSMRYREGPLVLKNFSVTIPAGSSVGIAGRTGTALTA